MPSDRVLVAPETRVSEVERLLVGDQTIRSVLVETGDEILCIDRVAFFSELIGPLGHGRSLWARHPITHMPHPQALVLPSSTTPVQAAQAVLERAPNLRYSDIVVRFPGGRHATVLVAELLAEVAYTHQYASLHDSLTGLPNRVLFLERLREASRRTRRVAGMSPYAILFVDLDDFKPINDVLGHEAGDHALSIAAERLLDHDLEDVTVARLAGDEFGVLVDHPCRAEEIIKLAEQLISALKQPMLIDEATVAMGASIGFALAIANDTPDELLRKADIAMYEAKRTGKGSYVAYSDGMDVHASRRLELRSQIDGAIERGEFRVVYQPVVELEEDTIIGAEALIRWERPGEGLIGPDQFIPLCEKNGMIVPLGTWILEECCRKAVEWADENPGHAPMSLSVNVSPRQLEQPGFADTVAQILDRTRMPPRGLVLEITENLLIQDSDAVLRRLAALKRLGVRLALDDFGAGFSSVSYLSRLPLDVLKLDRSFVVQADASKGRNLLNGVVTLAHSLDLITVAEGVETAEQADELRSLGCQRAQGYYFARPMSGESFRELLGDARVAPTLPAALSARARDRGAVRQHVADGRLCELVEQ